MRILIIDGRFTGTVTDDHIPGPGQQLLPMPAPAPADVEMYAMIQSGLYTLADLIESEIAKTYGDIDRVYDEKIGKRQPEYDMAEKDAIAYKAAGYPAEAPRSITSYAKHNITGQQQSNKWSADVILVQAEAMRDAQLSMREKRFEYQELLRAADSLADLQAAVDGWRQFINTLRARLGLVSVLESVA